MEGCHLSCLGQAWTGGGLASATRQALRWSLPQAHPQGHARVTPLPACSLPGAAGHPQPRHAQLPSLPGDLTVVPPQKKKRWFDATWTAVPQQPAPPLHADLLLADDRRGPWQPAARVDSLWQRLRLLVITQLWDAYCRARSRPEQPMQPAHIAARVISAARVQMRRDWLLVGSDIRLRAGVLSHWLRGRQPTMTAEAFQSRWCHEEVLCSRPAEVTEPPHMHWTAAHPVPLPR